MTLFVSFQMKTFSFSKFVTGLNEQFAWKQFFWDYYKIRLFFPYGIRSELWLLSFDMRLPNFIPRVRKEDFNISTFYIGTAEIVSNEISESEVIFCYDLKDSLAESQFTNDIFLPRISLKTSKFNLYWEQFCFLWIIRLTKLNTVKPKPK